MLSLFLVLSFKYDPHFDEFFFKVAIIWKWRHSLHHRRRTRRSRISSCISMSIKYAAEVTMHRSVLSLFDALCVLFDRP